MAARRTRWGAAAAEPRHIPLYPTHSAAEAPRKVIGASGFAPGDGQAEEGKWLPYHR